MLMSDGADRGITLLFELGLEEFIHADLKKPNRSIIALPMCFEARMAALFGGVETPDLSTLKLSRVESTGIKLLCNKSEFCGEASEKNARLLLSKYGELCESAVALYGTKELAELVLSEKEKAPCIRIADLALSGGELKNEGVEPRLIGEIMSYLLDLVIEDPGLNQKETLVKMAKNKEKIIKGNIDV